MSLRPKWMAVLSLALLVGAGCGPQRDGDTAAAIAEPTVAAIPTYTPTAVVVAPTAPPAVFQLAPAPTPTPEATEETPDKTVDPLALLIPTPTPETSAMTEVAGDTAEPEGAAETPASSTATEIDGPRLTVNAEAVNVRGGPGTTYTIVGAAAAGDSFAIHGRNEAGDWWQVCCFAGQPGWLFGPLVTVVDAGTVAVAADIPPPPEPVALPEVPQPPAEPDAEPGEDAPMAEAPATEAPPPPPVAPEHSGTAGNFDPNAHYHIVHYRTLGFDDNNGGIFNKGGQQLIFVTVLDQNGNPVDGAVLKDAVGDKLNVVTGSKGPGKAEIKMDWDPYKLYVAADPSGPVSSQISNQMNNPYPHIPDVVGLLGPADNEYAICPTPDDRCSPPFYHAHWSYEITFQRKH